MRESSVEVDTEGFLSSGYNVTGIIVNFCCSIRKAPPLIDTFIVPGGAAFLYALFEYGLTLKFTLNHISVNINYHDFQKVFISQNSLINYL